MTAREDLLQGVREWLKAGSAAVPLTDAQVYVAESDGPRVEIPYLSVRMTVYDITVGTDENRSGLDGLLDPVVSVRGQRRATVTVQAFGDQATDWLSEAKVSLHRPAIQLLLKSAGLAVSTLGSGQSNIVAVLADQSELRATQDFDLAYTYDSIEETGTALDTFELDQTFEGIPSDRVIDIDIQVC